MRPHIPAFSVLAILLLGGCAGMGPTTFVHPEYNFAFIESVAVVPFENISEDQGAGARGTRYFISELLSAEAFNVVEPGEVANALAGFGVVRTAELTAAQAKELGRKLSVQAVFLGSIGESATSRSGSGSTNTVTIVARLVETETGATIWSATHTEDGRSFWSSLFGTGEGSRSEVTRRCVKKAIRTLVR